jgi:hypothetical protein
MLTFRVECLNGFILIHWTDNDLMERANKHTNNETQLQYTINCIYSILLHLLQLFQN